jgi:hypothetical protein
VGENMCQLSIRQGTDNQNIQGTQKTKLSQNQQTNKEMASELNRNFLKRINSNGPKKHMKKSSVSLPVKEMPIKTKLRFHLTPVKIAILISTSKNPCSFLLLRILSLQQN